MADSSAEIVTPTPPPAPIQVDPNSPPKALMTGAQYLATSAISYAIGKGWISNEIALQLAAYVPVLVIGAYGVYKTWRNNEDKKKMNNYTPATVSVTKGTGT